MKYIKTVPFWITKFGMVDVSFGIHICWRGRVDFHILTWMISIGNVPIYEFRGKQIAVSNSYHTDKRNPTRAGVP